MTEKFWFVWCESGNAPRYKHTSKKSAEKEAERLAILHRPAMFHVLEWVGAVKVQDFIWQRPSTDDGIPF